MNAERGRRKIRKRRRGAQNEMREEEEEMIENHNRK